MFVLNVVTPKKTFLTAEIDTITVPSTDGQRTILSNHMTTVIALEYGLVHTVIDGEKRTFVSSEGLFTFENNVGTLLVTSVEDASNVDFAEAEALEERAESMISAFFENTDSGVNIEEARALLHQARVRLSLRD